MLARVARRVVLPPLGPKAYLAPPRFGELERLVPELGPDEAVFVTEAKIDANDGFAAVNHLRRSLKTRFWGFGLTFLEDYSKVGVWVYRPAFRVFKDSPAVGPAKEDEIRSRHIAD